MRVQIPSVLNAISPFVGRNAGVVTLIAGPTLIVEIDVGLCNTNQIILCEAQAQVTKGGVAGDCLLRLVQSAGTAVLDWGVTANAPNQGNPNVGAGLIWLASLMGSVRVTQGGTLTIRLEGSSAGSNGTIAANGGQLKLTRFNR
jgi:hypothetical protein